MGAPPGRAWTVIRPVDPPVLQRLLLYQGKTRYYLLGYNGEETSCRLLTFSRINPEVLRVQEDPKIYSPREAAGLLQQTHKMNMADGGLQLVCEAFGLLGCFRFLECYYLLLITKRRSLGSISGHEVYGVADTVLVPLDQPFDSASEKRYRKLFLTGVDLTKDFFFSYTYSVCYTLQYNLTAVSPANPFESMFVWNEYLTRDLRSTLEGSSHRWVLPLVHGSWQQRCLSVYGQLVTLTLVARRSRRFAGTRYLKRGINKNGWVANEVETEQVVCLGKNRLTNVPSLSSVVQLRGSIPLFWGQGTQALHPRPDIILLNNDPLYEATAKHFKDLHSRYGGPIVVLNLVKSQEKHPRETILRKEFGRAIGFLNNHVFEDDVIIYIPWDFKEHMSKDGRSFLRDIEPVTQTCIASTGLCVLCPEFPKPKDTTQLVQPKLQQGVLRTNCVDCLDRTNICQYAYGVVALGHQLHLLGLLETEEIDPDCSLAYQLMEMYETMGNVLAWQYGGSEAHGTFFDRMRGQSEAATQSRDMVTSLKRYYNNAVTDAEKQHAINLFLGNFIPEPEKPQLWDLQSDYYLHYASGRTLSRTNSGHSTMSHGWSGRLSFGVGQGSIAEEESEDDRLDVNSPLLQSVELYKLPAVSQTGDPEVKPTTVVADQPPKKEKKDSGWSFKSIFRSSRDSKVEFRPPQLGKDRLESFDEMLMACPVVHVRLHDSQSTFRGLRRLSFHLSFTRIAQQDAMMERNLRKAKTSAGRSRASTSFDAIEMGTGRVSSLTSRAKASLQALKQRSQRLRRRDFLPTSFSSFTDSRTPLSQNAPFNPSHRRSATPPVTSYMFNRSGRLPTPPPTGSNPRSLGRVRFSGSPVPGSKIHARAYSTPVDLVELSSVNEQLSTMGDVGWNEHGMTNVWSEYWGVTVESVAAEVNDLEDGQDAFWWDLSLERKKKWPEVVEEGEEGEFTVQPRTMSLPQQRRPASSDDDGIEVSFSGNAGDPRSTAECTTAGNRAGPSYGFGIVQPPPGASPFDFSRASEKHDMAGRLGTGWEDHHTETTGLHNGYIDWVCSFLNSNEEAMLQSLYAPTAKDIG